MSSEEVTVSKELAGRGNFGAVYKGTFRGETVAVKRFFKQNIDEATMRDIEKQLKEMSIMSNLRHPSIIIFVRIPFGFIWNSSVPLSLSFFRNSDGSLPGEKQLVHVRLADNSHFPIAHFIPPTQNHRMDGHGKPIERSRSPGN